MIGYSILQSSHYPDDMSCGTENSERLDNYFLSGRISQHTTVVKFDINILKVLGWLSKCSECSKWVCVTAAGILNIAKILYHSKEWHINKNMGASQWESGVAMSDES